MEAKPGTVEVLLRETTEAIAALDLAYEARDTAELRSTAARFLPLTQQLQQVTNERFGEHSREGGLASFLADEGRRMHEYASAGDTPWDEVGGLTSFAESFAEQFGGLLLRPF